MDGVDRYLKLLSCIQRLIRSSWIYSIIGITIIFILSSDEIAASMAILRDFVIKNEFLSGWLQAFGSIIAIGVSIFLSRSDSRDRKAVRNQEAVAYTIEILPYLMQIDSFIKRLKMSDDYYISYFNQRPDYIISEIREIGRKSTKDFGIFSALKPNDALAISTIIFIKNLVCKRMDDTLEILSQNADLHEPYKKFMQLQISSLEEILPPTIKRMNSITDLKSVSRYDNFTL